jgi:DNA-binding transcriptional MerR regulator
VQPINRDVSSKQRVYTEQDVNRIDALSCLSATGMSLRDMRSYMDHMSHGKASAKLEIELLRAQAARIETERQYLEVRERYVALKIAYWHAVEEDNTEAIAAIRTEARILAQELKHPKES